MNKRGSSARRAQKKYIVYCEGNTEQNYIQGFRSWLFENSPGTNVVIDRPVNMHGGGYREFYKYIRKSPPSNCIARFVIVDFDRCLADPNEMTAFFQLLEYCRAQTTRKSPCVLILSNPNFEYPACLHSARFRSQDPAAFICQEFKYGSIEEFKADQDVWTRLNDRGNGYERLIERCSSSRTLVRHSYKKLASSFSLEVKSVEYHEDEQVRKSSNLHELFDIVLH